MRTFVIVGAAIAAMLIIGNIVLPAIDPWLEAAVSFVRSQLIFIGVPADAALTAGVILHFVVSIALVWWPAVIAWRSWRRIRTKPWVYDWEGMQRKPWKYSPRSSINQPDVGAKPSWWRQLVAAMVDEAIAWIIALVGLTCIAALVIFFAML